MNTLKFTVEIISSTITSVFLMGTCITTSMLFLCFFSFIVKQEALSHYYSLIPPSYHKTIPNGKQESEIKRFIYTQRQSFKYDLIIEMKDE